MDYKKLYEIPNELDVETLKTAKKELNEKDAKQIENDIDSIKEWIKQQNYLKSRLDNDFILHFLRAGKYSFARTQELLKNYWVNRTEMNFFHNRNYDEDSIMMEIADLGIHFRLPYPDNEGRLIVIERMGMWDTEKFELEDIAKYMFSSIDLIVEDPRAQINGIILLLDMTGFNTSHAGVMSPQRAQRIAKCVQDSYPMRIKSLNYYNYPKVFDAVFSIVKIFLKDKTKKRIKFHGSDLKSVHKEIPKSILPKDYGGDLDTCSKINEAWVDHLRSRKNMLLELQNFGADLSKVPKEGQSSGTFRKLNVD